MSKSKNRMSQIVQSISDNADNAGSNNNSEEDSFEDIYTSSPVDMGNRMSKSAALHELSIMQSHIAANYKTWAGEQLRYSNCDNLTASDNLKKCNDAYTMSMFTNCLTAFRSGITPASLISSWFTYKTAEMLNPTFNQDMSKMVLNLRDSMAPMLVQNMQNGNFLVKSLSKGTMAFFDKAVISKSSNTMHNELVTNLKNNTLDSMTMTPRQIAAIKINFMEQCYVDMRSCNPSDRDALHKCKTDYDTALNHLKIIANNSGFDMSIVAAEERNFVGLKIADNPEYANIFKETSSLCGVRPYNRDSDDIWAGDFNSLDGHNYLTTNDHDGAFSINMPHSENMIKQNLLNEGVVFGNMLTAINSMGSEVSDSDRNQLKKDMSNEFKSYKKKAMSSMQDDLGISSSNASELFDSTFSKACEHAMHQASGMPVNRRSVFMTEVNRIVDKECCEEKGVEYFDSSNSDEYNKMLINLMYNAQQEGYGSMRSGAEVLSDMRKTYIHNMSEPELHRLFLHALNNQRQNFIKTKSFVRSSDIVDDFDDTIEPMNPTDFSDEPQA